MDEVEEEEKRISGMMKAMGSVEAMKINVKGIVSPHFKINLIFFDLVSDIARSDRGTYCTSALSFSYPVSNTDYRKQHSQVE